MLKEELRRRIDQAVGREPADLVIVGARIVNTATGRIEEGDIAICGDTIVSVGPHLQGRTTVDAAGRFPEAIEIFRSLSTAETLSPFLTLPAYRLIV